jgi:hypothetical protein
VLSYSGTFVNQASPQDPKTPRGGWEYHATMIPKSPKKPIRIWMEVGEKDLHFDDADAQVYYLRILNATGKSIYMLPRPLLQHGLDISTLAAGVYFIQITDDKTKIISTKKFIKE